MNWAAAVVFDLSDFQVAKKVWATLCVIKEGCFFRCGACLGEVKSEVIAVRGGGICGNSQGHGASSYEGEQEVFHSDG